MGLWTPPLPIILVAKLEVPFGFAIALSGMAFLVSYGDPMPRFRAHAIPACCATFFLALLSIPGFSQAPVTDDPPYYGPYNAVFLPDGDGLQKPLEKTDSVLRADSPWSLYAWTEWSEPLQAPTLLAGIGNPEDEYSRYLAVDLGQAILWMGKDNSISGPVQLVRGKAHLLAATFDGRQVRVYADGVSVAEGKLLLGPVGPSLEIAPAFFPTSSWRHFGGKISGLTVVRRALSPAEIQQILEHPNGFVRVDYEEGSKPWPVQTRAQAGYRAPQDPSSMPHSQAPFSQPMAKPLPSARETLEPSGSQQWTFTANWKMLPAPQLRADGAAISEDGFNTSDWMAATVPGTALTTLIDRGIYPDPDYGLNNLLIPESLNQQDYWYRVEFRLPQAARGNRLTLAFDGINYEAAVWLNGRSLGSIKGAFIRGKFDVTDALKPDRTNVLAVRVSPPPHPGIPEEQSIKGGPGENGGLMCLDGPTFVATEGWDWVPAIRDRDTGIWQPVTLRASGRVEIGDPQVVTTLPLPDTSRAAVEITVPLDNGSERQVTGTVKAVFGEVAVTKSVVVPPGVSSVKLSPAEFPQLDMPHPRLWWPNGYGKPELYTLRISFSHDHSQSATRQLRFGIREVTYELSLLDSSGHLRRVEYSPSAAREKHQHIIDVSHRGIRNIPAADPFPSLFPPEARAWWNSWVYSFAPNGESSAAVDSIDDPKTAPYLVIKVNGVRIACRGGNWGMDDSRKRVSRQRLEPYFRLHRDANLNMIRNWVGQNTEEVFYQLADEYGLMVWNDFWESTQNYNIEAQDPDLFLGNARDTILRFRNHPSIVVWCGRNEGVPQPILNEGLDELVRSLDGTRYYSPSSNQIELQNSGPYKYTDPVLYYTTLNHGFSVETGTPSFSTLESFRAWIPEADQWPISDDWAYHDWHQSGNGAMAPFMAEIESEFGAPTSLEDFDRKAQMLDYVDHRAIFEGMNAHLWAPNSGRLLWMTQPAWPSNTWQILTHDYDTQSSYYAVKKACEPVHVQLDLSNYEVAILNTTTQSRAGLSVSARVNSLENKLLLHQEGKSDAAADTVTDGFKLDLAPLLSANPVVLVKLELRDSAGAMISDNLYWIGADGEADRALDRLPAIPLTVTAKSFHDGEKGRVQVALQNPGATVSLQDKLTLLNADGSRILPVYYSDNYVSLLPGETREIAIEYPASAAAGATQLAIRGWNAIPKTIAVP
jgi:Exo-beta-D-glucosaminidase Ig-fold domain/Glycosyl hydrolases family 2/Concanavalin A-like lectin/glucanases superfamily/Glycosyl hydrolases family 2, TIM barrel domain/Glycosyl hydrolases family 2, sugar binding domain